MWNEILQSLQSIAIEQGLSNMEVLKKHLFCPFPYIIVKYNKKGIICKEKFFIYSCPGGYELLKASR